MSTFFLVEVQLERSDSVILKLILEGLIPLIGVVRRFLTDLIVRELSAKVNIIFKFGGIRDGLRPTSAVATIVALATDSTSQVVPCSPSTQEGLSFVPKGPPFNCLPNIFVDVEIQGLGAGRSG